jgi:hypothetical protein
MRIQLTFGSTRLLCVLLLAMMSTAALQAQSDSSQIVGVIKDATGSSIPGAKVSAVNEGTGVERQSTSNQEGNFTLTNLPPGYYTVTVESTGFKRFVKTANKLDAAIPLSMDIQLDVGAVTESVEVVAQAATVQADSSTVGRTVEATQIENMALNGRNPLLLAQLKPGVRSSAMNRFTFGLDSAGLTINGARTQDFLITFDGAVGIRTRSNGTSVGTADPDTVQEVQILTSNYSAEYGRSAGGQVRMVTKSGGRDFHFTGYEYLRNRSLDANSWQRNVNGQTKPQNTFNQFGYVVSGPVFIPKTFNTERNKLFFLWAQELVRYRREVTSQGVVPTPLMRAGNFSELLSPNPLFTGSRVVNDPTTGQPFAGNIIPASRLSANGLGLLASFPDPTPGYQQGRNNWFAGRPQPQNQRKDTLSIDFVPSTNHTFRVRWANYEYDELQGFRGTFDRAVQDWSRPNDTGSVNHIWTIGPTMINEFLATASVDRVYIGVETERGVHRRSAYGINYPYIYPDRKEIFDKIPTVTIGQFSEVDGAPYPAQSAGPIYVLSNNTTKILNNHTIKFGVFFERSGQNDFDQINVSGVPGGTNNQNGRFIFSDARTGAPSSGLAVANAALGLFDTYAEIGPRAYTPYRGHMFEGFLQDSWKVNTKLRLELGIRYTIMQPYYYSLWRNIVVFDPSRYDPAKAVVMDNRGNVLSGDRYNGVVIPGDGWPEAAIGRVPIASDPSFDRLFTGGSKTYGQLQKNNWGPRVGLAYAFTPKNVIRAGFGTFFQRPGVADNVYLGGQAPFQPFVSVANGNVDNPGGTQGVGFPFYFMTQDPVFKIPRSHQWNVTFERELPFSMILTAAYIGRVGTHLERVRNINQLQPGTVQANPGVNVNTLRPYKGFAQIDANENAARSEYNSFQLEANRRFSRGLLLGFAYTYSKSLDNASERRDIIWNAFDDRNYWGHSSFDTRHMIMINYVYELPFFRESQGLKRTLLGGWQVSGNTQWQTGTPFSIVTNDDFAGIGGVGSVRINQVGRTNPQDGQPWNINGPITYPGQFSASAADPATYFSVDVSRPAATTFANQTRNMVFGPSTPNWNISAFKNFRMGERHNLQFRAEFFNFPNHPNYNTPDFSPTSGTFGKVTAKNSERNIQLVLRYSF